jgi:hypothetical protein
VSPLEVELNTGEERRRKMKGRAILYPRAEILALRAWAKDKGHDKFLVEGPRGQMEEWRAQKVFRRTADRCGLDWLTAHYLRHAQATHMAIMGVSPVDIAQILGHASIRITSEVYLKRQAARTVGAVSRMGGDPTGIDQADVQRRIQQRIEELGGPVILPARFRPYLPRDHREPQLLPWRESIEIRSATA